MNVYSAYDKSTDLFTGIQKTFQLDSFKSKFVIEINELKSFIKRDPVHVQLALKYNCKIISFLVGVYQNHMLCTIAKLSHINRSYK